jgi:hypothetical protein
MRTHIQYYEDKYNRTTICVCPRTTILFFCSIQPEKKERTARWWNFECCIRQHAFYYYYYLLSSGWSAPPVGGTLRRFPCPWSAAYVSIRQHTSAYVSIRQHTSAYVSIRQHTSAYVSIRQHTFSLSLKCFHRRFCVSICTFVLAKQVLLYCTSKSSTLVFGKGIALTFQK